MGIATILVALAEESLARVVRALRILAFIKPATTMLVRLGLALWTTEDGTLAPNLGIIMLADDTWRCFADATWVRSVIFPVGAH